MLLALAALLAGAGGEVLSARAEAALEENGADAAVRIEYRIALSPGTDRVSFSMLEVEGVRIENFSAVSSGAPLAVEIAPRTGPKLQGTIGIPEGASSPFGFELGYEVRAGTEIEPGGMRVRLPLAVLDLANPDAGGDRFSAGVVLPPGRDLIDGFPSNYVTEGESGYRWELPIVPAFLSFHATSGPGLLSPRRLATAALSLLLVIGGIAGVRRARRMSG